MDSSQEDLADYVRRVRGDKGFSTADVEKNSGFTITDAYVSRIENRYVKNVSPEKLKALARGLRVQEDQIFAVARGKALSPMSPTDFLSALEAMGVEHFQAFGGVERLTPDDQQEIISMIEAMIGEKLKRKARPPD